MSNPDDLSVRQELKRLRERLDFMHERHATFMDEIRIEIRRLELKLGPEPVEEMKPVEIVPPPLPEKWTPKLEIEPPTEPQIHEEIEMPKAPVAPREEVSFELNFGKIWFVRIGIVVLLTGLVFLGNYAYQNWIRDLSAGVRLAALYACAIALFETGRRLAAKVSLSMFGEVLLAGGMAFFYYCTFAAHHVERLKVIESPVLAAILLFAAAGSVAAVSWLRQARATAVLGIVLASYSTMLQPIGWMSCVSNMTLGAAGLFFMLRPAWSGPGWASMLGSYGAFLGWQLMGASGGKVRLEDPATLWFLPPVWVMFAIPGVVDRFRESLGERARAWFTAANNGFFFLLFSSIWVYQKGNDDYWMVAAVFGSILIALGILGRSRDTMAGGVNLAQGLAVATYALVLKLDGHHLALMLAFESVTLALAFRKFRGRSEAVFSLLAAIGSAGIILGRFPGILDIGGAIPIWSGGLAGALLLAASVIMRFGTERCVPSFETFARMSTRVVFVLGVGVLTFGFVWRLDSPWHLVATIILSGAFSVASLRFDGERKLPELPWGALWFLGVVCYLGIVSATTVPGLATVVAVSLGACWLWHGEARGAASRPNLEITSAILAWAHSIVIPGFLWLISTKLNLTSGQILVFNQVATVALVLAAVFLRCSRLAQMAGIAGFLTLHLLFDPRFDGAKWPFTSSFLALAAAFVLMTPWAGKQIEPRFRNPSCGLFRITATIAYCMAWHRFTPDTWFEWLAVTSMILTVMAPFLRWKLPLESIALLAVALIGFVAITMNSPWAVDHTLGSWRGIMVVVALLLMLLTYRQRPALIEDPDARLHAINLLAGLTACVSTFWATQMLVWRFGWKPAAILWTLLGFAYVSAGLWQRLRIFRVSGFILLVISFSKLFLVDVWEFNTFMRVASFIVLGAALILLGLFYNHFAPFIKRLLEDEKELSSSRDAGE